MGAWHTVSAILDTRRDAKQLRDSTKFNFRRTCAMTSLIIKQPSLKMAKSVASKYIVVPHPIRHPSVRLLDLPHELELHAIYSNYFGNICGRQNHI